jgi:hypothetical protein
MTDPAIATLPRQRPSKAQSLRLIHAVALHFLIGLADTVDELDAEAGGHKDLIARLLPDRRDLYDDLVEAYKRKKTALIANGERR